MRVLIACEESQRVATEFRRLGHEAYSCDIEPCGGGYPMMHLNVDALQMLKLHWDLVIATTTSVPHRDKEDSGSTRSATERTPAAESGENAHF